MTVSNKNLISIIVCFTLLVVPRSVRDGESYAQSNWIAVSVNLATIIMDITDLISEGETIYKAADNVAVGKSANFDTRWSQVAKKFVKAERDVRKLEISGVGLNFLAAEFFEGFIANCELGEPWLVEYKKKLIDDRRKLHALSSQLEAALARTKKFNERIPGLADTFSKLVIVSTAVAQSQTNMLAMEWLDLEDLVQSAVGDLIISIEYKIRQINELVKFESEQEESVNIMFRNFLKRCPLKYNLKKLNQQQMRDLVVAQKRARVAIMDSSGRFIGAKAFWGDYVFSHSEKLRRDIGVRQIFIIEGTGSKNAEFTIKTQNEDMYLSCWHKDAIDQLKSGLRIADAWEKFRFEPLNDSDIYMTKIVDFTGNHLSANRERYDSIQCNSLVSGTEAGFLIYQLM